MVKLAMRLKVSSEWPFSQFGYSELVIDMLPALCDAVALDLTSIPQQKAG